MPIPKNLKNFSNAGLYLSGSFVQAGISLIMQPLYSIHMTSGEFGILGYFDAIKSFFFPIFIFGMTSVYLMKYFKKSEEENKKSLFNIAFFLCIFNTLLMLLSYLVIYYYFKLGQSEMPLNPFAWIVLLNLIFDNLKSFLLINLRIRKKAWTFFLISTAQALLNGLLGYLLVVEFEFGAEGRAFAPLLATIVLLPLTISILRKYTIPHINFKEFLQNFNLAIPLVIAGYAYVPIIAVDRFFLESLDNISELGLYSIGLTIGGYINLIFTALSSAFEPDIYESVVKLNYPKLLKTGLLIFVPYLAITIIYIIFSDDLISLLTSNKFMGAVKYTNLIVVAIFFQSFFWYFDKIFIAMEKNKLKLIVTSLSSLLAIIIMYMSVNSFQFLGAAYAKITISILMSLIALYLTVKHLTQHKKQSELQLKA